MALRHFIDQHDIAIGQLLAVLAAMLDDMQISISAQQRDLPRD
ncbi:hypothetical protein [Methylocapsa aurea]